MAEPTDETLDALEALAAERLRGSLRDARYENAEYISKVIANLALYRRLRSGIKLRMRADGTADIAAAMP